MVANRMQARTTTRICWGAGRRATCYSQTHRPRGSASKTHTRASARTSPRWRRWWPFCMSCPRAMQCGAPHGHHLAERRYAVVMIERACHCAGVDHPRHAAIHDLVTISTTQACPNSRSRNDRLLRCMSQDRHAHAGTAPSNARQTLFKRWGTIVEVSQTRPGCSPVGMDGRQGSRSAACGCGGRGRLSASDGHEEDRAMFGKGIKGWSMTVFALVVVSLLSLRAPAVGYAATPITVTTVDSA